MYLDEQEHEEKEEDTTEKRSDPSPLPQGEEVSQAKSVDSLAKITSYHNRTDQLEITSDSIDNEKNNTINIYRSSPNNPDRDQFGHFIPNSPLFGPDRFNDDVTHKYYDGDWNHKDPNLGDNPVDNDDLDNTHELERLP